MKRKQEYKMPDGSYTTDGNKMAKAWYALAKPFEKATGYIAIAFDPQVTFTTSMGVGGNCFTLSVEVLQKLNEKLK